MAGRVAPIQLRYVHSASSENTPDPSAYGGLDDNMTMKAFGGLNT